MGIFKFHFMLPIWRKNGNDRTITGALTDNIRYYGKARLVTKTGPRQEGSDRENQFTVVIQDGGYICCKHIISEKFITIVWKLLRNRNEGIV